MLRFSGVLLFSSLVFSTIIKGSWPTVNSKVVLVRLSNTAIVMLQSLRLLLVVPSLLILDSCLSARHRATLYSRGTQSLHLPPTALFTLSDLST